VVVPTHDRRELVGEVLRALGRQSYPAERFEAVVVLDGCTDGSAELLRSLELPCRLRTLEQRNGGAAASRNRGAREAAEQVVVFLDDDVVPEPGCLLAHAEAHAGAGAEHVVMGPYPPAVGDGGLWALAIRAWWEDHFRRAGETGHQWNFVDFATGNASLPRRLFLEEGGFDEKFDGRGREDWELAVRLLGRGVPFEYAPAARAAHRLDTTFGTALRLSRRDAHADVHLGSKHPHVKAHLPLAQVALALGEGRSPRVLFAYRHPETSERLARAALPLLDTLEALGLRGRWLSLAQAFRRHAYVLGLADVLPTPERFLSYVAPIWREGVEFAPLRLDRAASLRLPARAGAVELAVEYHSAQLASVVAADPTGQFELEAIAARVGSEAGQALREAVLIEELLRLPQPTLVELLTAEAVEHAG